MNQIKIYVNIWPGKYIEGQKIIDDLISNKFINVTAVVSGRDYEIKAPEVIYLRQDAYFGEQFVHTIKRFNKDILIQIQADAIFDNAKILIESCKKAFESQSNLGIWAPDINYTSWINEINYKKISLNRTAREQKYKYGMLEVLNTDCTFWAISKEVVNEMNKLDLELVKYGWGLDITASAICRSKKLKVMRDLNLKVIHPKGTGYNETEASNEWRELQKRLSIKIKYHLLVNRVYLTRNKIVYLIAINIKRLICPK